MKLEEEKDLVLQYLFLSGVRESKARKQYDGCTCQSPILPGQVYVFYGKPSLGWPHGWRMHKACVEAKRETLRNDADSKEKGD